MNGFGVAALFGAAMKDTVEVVDCGGQNLNLEWVSVTGDQRLGLVIGCWLLVIGCWFLVVGCCKFRSWQHLRSYQDWC